MKTFLKFTGIIAALFALVAFILLIATPAIISNLTGGSVAGQNVIFGGKTIFGDYDPTWNGLLAFIFILVALLLLVVTVVAELANVKALAKLSGLFNFIAAGLLIVAGIFAFIVVPVWAGDYADHYAIGAGWVIAGILSIAGGAVALLPAIMKLVK